MKPAPDSETVKSLAERARRIRVWSLKAIHAAGSGHPGGSLSIADVLAVLYFQVLRYDPNDPDWEGRDRFILSKGHGVPALYAALAEAGFYPHDRILELRKLHSPFEGHPDRRKVPGVEASTGSLGQGLSVGIGMALGARLDDKHRRHYVLVGDGEVQEGQIWEASNFAGHHRLSNLTLIVDANDFQLDGPTRDILDLHPLGVKWEACGWATREVDGHDIPSLVGAFEWAGHVVDRPQAIIARTVKGKGVSFMEGNNHYHGVAPTDEEIARALKELGEEDAA